ncbi:hypothetical protein [Kribbella sp. NPDC023855]|uniref:hypothetical protein n=1 Tax=Kribbella sp. NPDC023855 TaxID=3154698 RepID=UPI0033C7C3C3
MQLAVELSMIPDPGGVAETAVKSFAVRPTSAGAHVVPPSPDTSIVSDPIWVAPSTTTGNTVTSVRAAR